MKYIISIISFSLLLQGYVLAQSTSQVSSISTHVGGKAVQTGNLQHISTVGQIGQSGGTSSTSGVYATYGFLTQEDNITNQPPTANAGEDFEFVLGEEEGILDGSQSSDPEGSNLEYIWSTVGEGFIPDSTVVAPSFDAGEVKAIRHFDFVLTVSDGNSNSLPDTVTVTVVNPDWVPQVYTNSATLYGLVYLNDTTMASKEDYVGAYVNGENRGIGQVRIIQGKPYVIMNIQLESEADVQFKIYDYSEDVICDVSVALLVAPGVDSGSPSEPVEITGNCTACSRYQDQVNLLGVDDYCGESFVEVQLEDTFPDVYQITWSTGDTTARVTNVNQDEYAISLFINGLNCEITKSVKVNSIEPISSEVFLLQETNCGANNGMAEVVVGGGIAPYSYSWTNGEGGAIAENLGAGINTVTITDAGGCQVTTNVNTGPSDFPIISQVVIENYSCGDSQSNIDYGAIEVNVIGGTPSYSFEWSNGSSNQNINQLEPGSYTLTVTDANGCIALLDSVEVENLCSVSVKEIEVPQIVEHSIYPNPFSSNLNVMFRFDRRVEGNISIFDMSCRILEKHQVKGLVYSNQLDFSRYANGEYVLQLSTIRKTWRFLVVKI